MRKVAIALSKGGVGKSTTAVNLASALAHRQRRVLLLDMDTQGQTARMLKVTPAHSIADVINGEVTLDAALVEARSGLALLAGGRGLAGLKRAIDRKEFGGEQTLREALTPLDGSYDYVIVDTAPGWDVLTVNALFFADEAAWRAFSPNERVRAPASASANGPDFYVSVGLYDAYGSYAGALAFVRDARAAGHRVTWRPLYGGHCAVDVDSVAAALSED